MFPHTSHTLRGRRLAIIVALALSAAPSLAQTAGPPDADWPEANRDLRGDRYSPLKEITLATVGQLRPVAFFETGQECSFQTNPVVVDGTMYLTTYNHTYAIDAATGKLKWKNVMPLKATGTGAQRGVAYLDGKVFRGAPDGQVYAFDAANGHELWHTRIADPAIGESIPAAPIAWNGLVIIGNAGGDIFGVVGRIYGLDAETGKQVWRFDVIPKSGPAAATWHMQGPKVPPTGGTTWTTYALDPDTGVLYTGTGNPAPDFAIGLRPGENLYATCVVALDAKTGHLLAWVQPTPHDFHDWDVSAAPALITTRGGLHLAATGGKDGYLHGIEVSRVERAASAGSGPVTVSMATDKYGAAGRGAMVIRYSAPVTRHINTTAPLTTTHFTRFAPGS